MDLNSDKDQNVPSDEQPVIIVDQTFGDAQHPLKHATDNSELCIESSGQKLNSHIDGDDTEIYSPVEMKSKHLSDADDNDEDDEFFNHQYRKSGNTDIKSALYSKEN